MEAESGQDAMAQATHRRPHLVLLDVNMPGLDGYETACCMRDNAALKNVRLIAVCDTLTEDTQHKCKESGFDSHTLKPIQINHLLATIQEQTELEWIYEDDTSKQAEKFSKQEFVIPPLEIMKTLNRLSRQGDLMEIQQQAKQLIKNHPELTPFCDKLMEYAGKFMVNKLKTYIEETMNAMTV
ncbi:MAG: hypothetical protein OMM_03145 [Candidatus Magnetoglobus multicellularis str. Araruama]|uniref:Response regulatory domain-containing protein n=1 Tax=Candidatus Magnetoglobus multicellularis str. Araruama TaxID=890399 RepID=A0A1V1P6P9_9BACT|nr:MAG: hypothetical protein OMM_03145 [Candidatus Magnetoglobus multicellularis str. Araruama]